MDWSKMISKIKGLSEKDRQMIEEADQMIGPDPNEMGPIKNLFWGRIRDDLIFPYPELNEEEKKKNKPLLTQLEAYLKNEHPSVQIDTNEETPEWVLKRLFDMGVMGMTISKEYGGLGLGVTSYNQVLQRIGARCASTAVIVSAHQSIGCKALMLYGTSEQKRKYLPMLATKSLSAFCLSEPNVGSDAAGQETTYTESNDGKYFILNGEKKWATSGALAAMFTVITRKQDAKATKKVFSAFICTPDMEGIDIFEKNRSKCGIRGTWQARIRFTNVRVPKEHLLWEEGKGIHIALGCLNYGRCTLSAGILGNALTCRDQAVKWAETRFQFGRPLSDFQLIQEKLARMSAFTYAMDAMLYMTTGMLDRKDTDIMVETAACKVFCSEIGWRVINDSVQIMGGDGYMTENELERGFRDSRIYLIVEGANEVMQTFVFAYGGKQLFEYFLALMWDPEQSFGENIANLLKRMTNGKVLQQGIAFLAEVFLKIKPKRPELTKLHSSLSHYSKRFSILTQEHSYHFKKMIIKHRESLITKQVVQARIADVAIWLHAYMCTLSKLDMQLRKDESGVAFERDKAAALHFFDLAEREIRTRFDSLYYNADKTLDDAAKKTMNYTDTLPNSDFIIHQKSPNAKGTGRKPVKEFVKQFLGGKKDTQDVKVQAKEREENENQKHLQ